VNHLFLLKIPEDLFHFSIFALQFSSIMTHDKEIKIYEWVSYVLLIGATAVFIILRKGHPALSNTLTLLILVVAMFMRMLMERARRKSFEEENESLKADLKHLTSLLRKEKQNTKDN
jgi:hypothetical protein